MQCYCASSPNPKSISHGLRHRIDVLNAVYIGCSIPFTGSAGRSRRTAPQKVHLTSGSSLRIKARLDYCSLTTCRSNSKPPNELPRSFVSGGHSVVESRFRDLVVAGPRYLPSQGQIAISNNEAKQQTSCQSHPKTKEIHDSKRRWERRRRQQSQQMHDVSIWEVFPHASPPASLQTIDHAIAFAGTDQS